jgi:hypothetical protein
MAKDPAFLFYSSDFLSGVTDLTMEERGQYITLLCLQHQKGELNDKTIRLTVGSVSVDVIAKFQKSGDCYKNLRLETEILKRLEFTESRRLNGQKGGRPKASGKPLAKPSGKPKKNLPEDVNENRNKGIVKFENLVFPFDSKDFMSVWDVLTKEKKWRKKSVSALQASLEQLSKYPEQTAIQMMKNTIAGEWQGLFEITTKTNGKSNGTPKTFDKDKLTRLINERYGITGAAE